VLVPNASAMISGCCSSNIVLSRLKTKPNFRFNLTGKYKSQIEDLALLAKKTGI